MVICLERGSDLYMAQLMPLPLTVSCFSKIQVGLPFWYRLMWVVPEKGPLIGCVCVYLYKMYDALQCSVGEVSVWFHFGMSLLWMVYQKLSVIK